MTDEKPLAGVLFDLDGTLVDTAYIHTVCWWEAMRQHGQVVPMSVIHRAIGMGSDKLLAHVLGDGHDKSSNSDMVSAHGALFATWHPRLHPLPGAGDLLERCAHLGFTVVIATSSPEHDLAALRRALDADRFIDEVTTSADAQESKPDPDILAAALQRTRLSAQEVVFVGDAVWDVQASAQLGIRCIGLECGGTSNAELRKAGAIEVWKDPLDLLHSIESSVLQGGH